MDEPKIIRRPTKKNKSPVIAGILIVIIFFSAILVIKFIKLKSETTSIGGAIYGKAMEGKDALKSMDTEKAKNAFSFVNEEIKKIKNKLDESGLTKIFSWSENISPKIKEISGGIADSLIFSEKLYELSDKIDILAKNSFSYIFNKQGPTLLKLLADLKNDIKAVNDLSSSLKARASIFGIDMPNDYLAISVKLYKSENLLDSLLALLNSGRSLHLAILFQNPSEIRPAGGFIGSYAHIEINEGSVVNIDVRDIYDPDGWIEEKIIPPQPLQGITNTWEARDANWFFDFPTSAEKVISMLNRSKIYSEKNITFSGALAINVHIIEDILGVLGPIPLPDYDITITQDNFLEQVQREVESGEDKSKGEPKKILKVLTPIILDKLANLSGLEKNSIANLLISRIETKDLMAYTRDRVLEGYLQNEKLGGEIFSPDGKDSDDYLAIVHANIAGGKTDALIEESITLESSVDMRGKISDKLTITRKHTGQDKKEWWYKTPNKDYFQVLALGGTRLLSIVGHDKKPSTENTKRAGYISDADINAIEKSAEWLPEFKVTRLNQFSKSTFANWLTIKAGETKTLALEYENSESILVAEGVNYRFVYEKQSGAKSVFRYSIDAPPGYVWNENNKTKYTFGSDNPESRIILDLTLKKLN